MLLSNYKTKMFLQCLGGYISRVHILVLWTHLFLLSYKTGVKSIKPLDLSWASRLLFQADHLNMLDNTTRLVMQAFRHINLNDTSIITKINC